MVAAFSAVLASLEGKKQVAAPECTTPCETMTIELSRRFSSTF